MLVVVFLSFYFYRQVGFLRLLQVDVTDLIPVRSLLVKVQSFQRVSVWCELV